LTRNPDLHPPVVNGIRGAPHPGVRIAGIAPGTDLGEVDRRSGFEIAMKDVARIHGGTELFS
jgi:hypothetical protein